MIDATSPTCKRKDALVKVAFLWANYKKLVLLYIFGICLLPFFSSVILSFVFS